MLVLSDTAATAVKTIIDQAPDAEAAGLRINPATGPQGGFSANVVAGAEPNDTIVESEGARVFLEESVAVVLDDKVLDAQVDPSGAITFAIAEQRTA